MSKATNKIKEMRKQNNMQKNNTKHNRINKLEEKQEYFNIKYSNPTANEMEAKLLEHKMNGTIYKIRKNRDMALKYIYDWKYTVDVLATYSAVGYDNTDKYGNTFRTMCLKEVYLLVRETGECISIDHLWLDERLAEYAVVKYTGMYGRNGGHGRVFIARLKAMRYADSYSKNGTLRERYQLSSESKQNRANYVKSIQEATGIHMTNEEIRAML